MGTREKIDKLGNEMIRNDKMPIRDIQANTLAILSSMYDEAKRRDDLINKNITKLNEQMKLFTWVGGIIASAVILYLVGNVLKIPEIQGITQDQAQIEVNK